MKLTILTTTVPPREDRVVFVCRQKMAGIARYCLRRPRPFVLPRSTEYGGHPAVTRSLLTGLQQLDKPFNYNPKHIADVGDCVIVLSGLPALRQAIRWKRRGKIRRLLAGPNIVVRPADARPLVAAPDIDIYLVNSEWTRALYAHEAPEMAGRLDVWPAGIDAEYWAPAAPLTNRTRIVVYQKNAPEELLRRVESAAAESGREAIVVRYGAYAPDDFRQLLLTARAAVFLSCSESQGIALLEAWAMDVPTFVWEDRATGHGDQARAGLPQAAPYLSGATGRTFADVDGLQGLLASLQSGRLEFAPRQWVLEHQTDQKSAAMLWQKVARLYETCTA